MKCSLVFPCHNEEENVVPLYEGICRVIGENPEFEFIFVDDGSTDATLAKIKELRAHDPRVKYVSLLTNYGHQKALFAGLSRARGDYAVTMDADLQHPPEYIPVFIEEQKRTGAHTVVGRCGNRKKGPLKNLLSTFYYPLFSWATRIRVIPDASDFRLYTRQALDVLCSIKEREPFLRGMITSLHFKTHVVDYQISERRHGAPSYTFSRLMATGLQAILRFSDLPARLGIFAALVGILFSVVEAGHYIYLKLFTETLVPGQAELIVFLAFVSSIMLLMLSLIAHSITQVLDFLRDQPSYVVAESRTED